ncbi:hypothetical protein [Sphingomonas sp.]|uniref:hypothetical protein n=1 Tax=Sphingomonas sp. TaxID=28214 RepID=UPI0035C82DA1
MQSATDIVRHYWRSQLSMPRDARACDRSDYIALARRHGLTADEALARTDCLMESIYPMDASQSNLERLAVDPGRHRRSLEAFVKSDLLANRLCLFLVSDNCD